MGLEVSDSDVAYLRRQDFLYGASQQKFLNLVGTDSVMLPIFRNLLFFVGCNPQISAVIPVDLMPDSGNPTHPDTPGLWGCKRWKPTDN